MTSAFAEPSLGLAPRIVAEIFLVLECLKRDGASILAVEQNVRPVFEIAHRVSVLERGRVVATKPPAELVNDPRVMVAYLGMADRAAGPEREPRHG